MTGDSIDFSLNKWAGQPIQFLSYFDQIHSLVQGLSNAQELTTRLLVRGNSVCAGTLTELETAELRSILVAMDWLRKCRFLAQRFGICPPLPSFSKLSSEQWESVEELSLLLQDGEVTTPLPGVSLSMVVSGAPLESQLKGGDGILRLDKAEEVFDILGQQVRLGPVRYLFTETALISHTPIQGARAKLVFKGTENTKQILQLLSPGPERKSTFSGNEGR